MKAVLVLLLLLTLAVVSFSQTNLTSDKPADIAVLKFSWAELSPKVRSGGSSDNRVDVSMSGSAARSAEENSKSRAVDLSSSRYPSRSDKLKTVRYQFSLSIKNNGSKTIQAIRWGYFLYPKDQTAEPARWWFTTKAKIEPGKKKTLEGTSFLMGEPLKVKMPSSATRSSFNEKVVIVQVDYTDGSTWEHASPYQND